MAAATGDDDATGDHKAASGGKAASDDKHRLTALEGLAALSLDALSSVAYGPEAIVIVLQGARARRAGCRCPGPVRSCRRTAPRRSTPRRRSWWIPSAGWRPRRLPPGPRWR